MRKLSFTMEWTVADDHPSIKITDTIVSELKDWILTHNVLCTVHLSLCPPTFWLKPSDVMSEDLGSKNTVDNRQFADSNNVVVTISFKLATIHAEQLKLHTLLLTLNHHGVSVPALTTTKIITYLPFCCGVYKRPGFDAAFNAIKVLKPKLTEYNFARFESEWDEALVSLELFHGLDDCMKTIKLFQSCDSNESNVEINLLAVDVNRNLSYITAILSAFVE